MANVEYFDDEGAALSDGEIQSVARRQLIGSLVVVAVIAAVAALTAFRPVHFDIAGIAPQKSAAIQQPSFVTPPGQRVAGLVRHEVELP